jgi:hypothetical protein
LVTEPEAFREGASSITTDFAGTFPLSKVFNAEAEADAIKDPIFSTFNCSDLLRWATIPSQKTSLRHMFS